ncbi:MAG: tRNA pseudouridine(55) synthase TruB [Patescibacteria group bacterium]|nr:tRNA pseudouridine(55) synthase TruB [Patescibacteria group bacterium]
MPEIELSETLLIDKPAGMTSHDVVDQVRRIYKTRRVGHAGTLDPFATGLLIVAIGKATKDIQRFVGLDKEYIATARLGATSDTYDLTGQITQNSQPVTRDSGVTSNELQVTGDDVVKALMSFKGGYAQKAPAYSAKKVHGQKLYEMARRGEDVEHLRPIKNVDISEIELIDYKWPDVTFRIICSSGTYIRSLAHDLGEKLGCGAYLTALRRTRIGEYKIEDAKRLNELHVTRNI